LGGGFAAPQNLLYTLSHLGDAYRNSEEVVPGAERAAEEGSRVRL